MSKQSIWLYKNGKGVLITTNVIDDDSQEVHRKKIDDLLEQGYTDSPVTEVKEPPNESKPVQQSTVGGEGVSSIQAQLHEKTAENEILSGEVTRLSKKVTLLEKKNKGLEDKLIALQPNSKAGTTTKAKVSTANGNTGKQTTTKST